MATPYSTSSAGGAAAGGLHLPTGTATLGRRDVEDLVRRVRSNQLYNRQLSSVCQVNGLKSTGVKADLQRRITDHIIEAFHNNDAPRFYQIRASVENAMSKRATPVKPAPGRAPGSAQPQSPFVPGFGESSSSNGFHTGFGGQSRDAVNGSSSMGGYPGLAFHSSPFYTIEQQIGKTLICPAMSQHRNTVHLSIRLIDHPMLQRCVEDKSYRVMLFCAGESNGVQHIAFPHQSELKVNGGDFKANLRGLKNKPGSTRPVDITSALRLRSSYANNVDFTYALTTKKFFLAAYVCKVNSVDNLVSTIATRQRIPKASVIAEINKKAMDPDVVAVSSVLSLKCPLSYMRLETPCRGTQCSHIQCFDATSYLQLQEQGPQWYCPICNKSVPFEQLAVDEYVKDILQNTSKNLETVSIEPNGRWSTKTGDQDKKTSSRSINTFGDDDEIEISEVNVLHGRQLDAPKNPTPSQRTSTPASASVSRDSTSAAPRGAASTSAKRPAAQVIDLTLSSDEDDDEPLQRPAKRQNTGTNGFRGSSGGLGFLSESPLGFQ